MNILYLVGSFMTLFASCSFAGLAYEYKEKHLIALSGFFFTFGLFLIYKFVEGWV